MRRYIFFDLLVLSILFLIPIAGSFNVHISSDTFAGNDIIDQFLPWRFFLVNQITKTHGIPFWNSYTFCGTPFLGNIQNGIFYPFTYLLLLNKFAMFKLLYIIPAVVLSAGIYFLLLEFKIHRISSFLVALSIASQSGLWTGSLAILQSLSWFPFSLLLFLKSLRRNYQHLPLTVFSFALQFTGGYPQILFVTFIACLIIMLYTVAVDFKQTARISIKPFIITIVSIFLFLLLTSVQLLPTVELFLHSNRISTGEELTRTALKHGFNPLFILLSLIPGIFSKKLLWGAYLTGNTASILILYSIIFALLKDRFKTLPYRFLLFILFIIFLSLALGGLNPLNKILLSLPGFSFFRHSGTYAIICYFIYFSISGHGLSLIINSKNKHVWAFLASSGGLIFSVSLITYYSGLEGITKKILLQTFIINIILISILLFFMTLKKFKIPALFILTMFVLSDQILFLQSQSITSNYYQEIKKFKEVFSVMKENMKQPSRVIFLNKIIHPTENMLYEMETIDGYDPIIVKNYAEFLKDAGIVNIGLGNFAYFYYSDFQNKITDILNVGYVITPQMLHSDKLKPLTKVADYYLYKNSSVYPRAYFATKVELIDKKQIPKQMLQNNYVSAGIIFTDNNSLPDYTCCPNNPENELTEIKFQEYSNDRFKLFVRTNKEGFLVLADTYYPGWKAYDNGKKSEILRVNYFMRAIKLTPGEHDVVFEYDPWTFKIGKWLSIAGVILLILIWLNYKKI